MRNAGLEEAQVGTNITGRNINNLRYADEVIDISPSNLDSSPAFLMMYSAYELNKQSDNIQPLRTPFPIWNQSVVPCPVLTVAS